MGADIDPGAAGTRTTPTWVRLAGPTLVTLAIAGIGTYVCGVPGGASDADSEAWSYVFTLPTRLGGLFFVGIISGYVGGAAFGEPSSPWVGMSVAIGGYVIGAAAAIAGHAWYGPTVMIGFVPFAIAAGIGVAVGRRTAGSAGGRAAPRRPPQDLDARFVDGSWRLVGGAGLRGVPPGGLLGVEVIDGRIRFVGAEDDAVTEAPVAELAIVWRSGDMLAVTGDGLDFTLAPVNVDLARLHAALDAG